MPNRHLKAYFWNFGFDIGPAPDGAWRWQVWDDEGQIYGNANRAAMELLRDWFNENFPEDKADAVPAAQDSERKGSISA